MGNPFDTLVHVACKCQRCREQDVGMIPGLGGGSFQLICLAQRENHEVSGQFWGPSPKAFALERTQKLEPAVLGVLEAVGLRMKLHRHAGRRFDCKELTKITMKATGPVCACYHPWAQQILQSSRLSSPYWHRIALRRWGVSAQLKHGGRQQS